MTALIERGLRLVLAQAQQPPLRERVTLPVSKAGGGTLPGVDLNDSSALLDVMELDMQPDIIIEPEVQKRSLVIRPGIGAQTGTGKGRG